MTIQTNRAPVLTLWAAVVAEELGYDHDSALTMGKCVAGLYEHFRPRIPKGTKGWGAKGDLDLDFIRSLGKAG
jgi:hypothetical protein